MADYPRVADRPRILQAVFDNPAAGGLLLMAVAAAALLIANSPLSSAYFAALSAYVGPLTVSYWINDGLMAVFFLLVGLEIKREVIAGELSTPAGRILPGIAATGGMALPAAVYAALNWGDPTAMRGWAIPAATDIAFALGVLALLGSRVPASLKVFLTALAIIDDLGAVLIIALFYTDGLSLPALGGAGLVLAALVAMNRAGVLRLWPYLLLGAVLWVLVLRSGVHATLAGVALALTIPLRGGPAGAEPPLLRLEHALHPWVMFAVVPIFGFANAGVSFAGLTPSALLAPLPLGVAAGLFVGKLLGVFGLSALTIRLGIAPMPAGANWAQLLGVSLLCGIGFTMSLFIGALAFADSPALQDQVKVGILSGSLAAGLAGWAVLRFAPPLRRTVQVH
ncbi:MAG TPA: Na+/H+ antiporter NhaA [Roseococcus sp.]|nr:Na+/H+ antiporter NhaA [Roseococcus sp.]